MSLFMREKRAFLFSSTLSSPIGIANASMSLQHANTKDPLIVVAKANVSYNMLTHN